MNGVVFIIGGGPSAKGFDFNRLAGLGSVLAVNDAFRHVPFEAVVSMDGRWMSHRAPELKNRRATLYASRKHFCKWLGDDDAWSSLFLFDVDPYKQGMSDENGLYAKHSGAMALNLAYQARPERVYLFGFDHTNQPDAGQYSEHWYGTYEWRKPREGFTHMDEWIEDHNHAARQFAAAGIQVFNVSPISRVEAYERMTYDQFDDHLRQLQRA